eukprot:NODE_755_length_1807_cov_4.032423_g615_i0.p10 GENE.NODE_755_length_1807_cov_4.032423_g615_i0~~NODE_755_length_1807_cov_4.032423_g615_i0.p10  ORF type:complete len:53 (-),score=5.97 NODE_755_length_1807_cov_4.032423_g615_i0:1126-1284(-)
MEWWFWVFLPLLLDLVCFAVCLVLALFANVGVRCMAPWIRKLDPNVATTSPA